jgi:hypothetical protein
MPGGLSGCKERNAAIHFSPFMFGNKPRRILEKREAEVGKGENAFPDFAVLRREIPMRPQDFVA